MEELELDYYFEDMEACPCKKAFEGIDHPWEALAKKDEVVDFSKHYIKGQLQKGVVGKGNIVIGKGTKVDPKVIIEGPVIVGKNVTIRSGALIRPGNIIGNNVVIGHSVEVKNSIIFDEAKVSSHAFVGDCILGKGARIASGAITGNRRFDQKEIDIKINGRTFATGTEKFGAIIGEYARIGANCTTAPGAVIGKHSWTYSNLMIRGFVPKESMLKLKQETEVVSKERQVLSRIDNEGKI